jgi:hypothetical protein
MKVLDLRCSRDHRFEGWFGSEEDFISQGRQGLLECPMCGDKSIARLPSAPRLNVSGARDPVKQPEQPDGPAAGSAAEAVSHTMPAVWLRAVQHVLATTVDVGDRFADEARRIHYGETDERPIRGRATPEEADALRDEGIEVMALPLPAALKGPVQ